MAGNSGSRRWMEVRALLERMEPQVIEMFHRYEVPAEAAAEILDDVVILLLYRWCEVACPEAWLLETLEHKSWRNRALPSEPEARPANTV